MTELTTHALIDSFDDPNPYRTAFDLLDLTVRALLLTGLVYLWIDEQPGDVTWLWSMRRPERLTLLIQHWHAGLRDKILPCALEGS